MAAVPNFARGYPVWADADSGLNRISRSRYRRSDGSQQNRLFL